MTQPEDRLLRLNVVAARLCVTTRTVQGWCTRGQIAFVRLPGGHYRVTESECARIAKGDGRARV